jgi:hypothetical protein
MLPCSKIVHPHKQLVCVHYLLINEYLNVSALIAAVAELPS